MTIFQKIDTFNKKAPQNILFLNHKPGKKMKMKLRFTDGGIEIWAVERKNEELEFVARKEMPDGRVRWFEVVEKMYIDVSDKVKASKYEAERALIITIF